MTRWDSLLHSGLMVLMNDLKPAPSTKLQGTKWRYIGIVHFQMIWVICDPDWWLDVYFVWIQNRQLVFCYSNSIYGREGRPMRVFLWLGIIQIGYFDNFGQQPNKETITAIRATSHLSGSMSSAIILSAAVTNFFWSTGAATGAAPELELGLELELRGFMDAKVCGGGTAVFCLTFWHSCFFSFSRKICSKAKSRRVKQRISCRKIYKHFGIFLWQSCIHDHL